MNDMIKETLRVFVVPAEIMDVEGLTIYEQMVYMVLRSFCNAQSNSVWPSYEKIASLGRMSVRKAISTVDSLIEKGLIKKQTRKKVSKFLHITNDSNLYQLQDPKEIIRNKDIERGVVHSVHQGSAQRAPGVVHSVHQGSAQRAPKQYHLTKSFRTKSMNNNNIVPTDTKTAAATEKEKPVVVGSSSNLETNSQKDQKISTEQADKVKRFLKSRNIEFTDYTLKSLLTKANGNTDKVIQAIQYAIEADAVNVIGMAVHCLKNNITGVAKQAVLNTSGKGSAAADPAVSNFIDRLKKAGL